MSTSDKTVAISAKRVAVIFAAFVCSVSLLAQTGTSPGPVQKAQTVLVTFVDNGMSLAGGFPGGKSQAFRGKLFVEDELLATMQPAHFITFTFQPVTVEFTAQTWMATGPTGGAHITLDLVAGKHYFIEVRTRQAWPATKMFGIKEITCQQALKEHEHDKPLEASHAKAGGDPAVVMETSFPACS
jgi:hypothetical protein